LGTGYHPVPFLILSAMTKYIRYKGRIENFFTVDDICKALSIKENILQKLVSDPTYRTFSIPKKTGGNREICSPEPLLMEVQRRLNQYLKIHCRSKKAQNVFGFISPEDSGEGMNIIHNAKVHKGQPFILTLDIKDFFGSITAKMVRDYFQSELLLPKTTATIVALLCTWQKKLPTGAPTSPILSNIIFHKTDLKLEAIAKLNNWKWSRYADDITFSSVNQFSLLDIEKIKSIIEAEGFIINDKKTRVQRTSFRQMVTGLVVNEKVNIKREYLKNLRAIVHDCNTRGCEAAYMRHTGKKSVSFEEIESFILSVRSKIGFVGAVRGKKDTFYKDLQTAFNKSNKY
jgi:RNA-directed DNA polymerase